MTEANTRYLRRSWNRTKSHLPKHSSLPELHLLPKGRPLFHCGRCGFTNTLIPLCLWCTWTSQEAEHEFERSTPRARRATAPSRAILHVEFSTSVSSCAVPHDRSKKASHKTSVACNKRNQSISKPISLHSPVNAAIPTVSSVIPCRLGLTGGHNTVSDFREMSHDGHNLHGDDSRDATRIYIATQRRSLMNIGADFSVARDGVDDVATATHKV
ncbi:hypothetical protein B0H34DRAFT_157824 [Crassisporium funariophilum]|nr:hypothetical protein B0H34DRAFT_157824 [Crassisporium funariophilum]